MTAFAKLKMTALLVLALVGLVTGIGWAGVAVTIVKIDDLTEGPPSIALSNAAIVPTILPDSAGEFLHFTLPVTPNALNSTKAYTEIWEDRVGGTLSDRLLITYITNDSVVDVQFASDPAYLPFSLRQEIKFASVESAANVFAFHITNVRVSVALAGTSQQAKSNPGGFDTLLHHVGRRRAFCGRNSNGRFHGANDPASRFVR